MEQPAPKSLSRWRSLALGLGVAVLFLAASLIIRGASAQDSSCGLYGKKPCSTIQESYCKFDLVIGRADLCDFNRSSWTTKALDMTRTGSVLGQPCGGGTPISCWKLDDQVRDSLEMNASSLNFVTEIIPNVALPQNGRFIFVYRATDAKLMIRRYDRVNTEGDPTLTACLDYFQYRYPSNYVSNIYQHVRHTQLNSGWSPVYCAGEMTIKDGGVWRLNNASGHYQPDAACLVNVENTLGAYGVRFNPDFQKGPYTSVHATETSCPLPPSPPPSPSPDDKEHDEL